jgi:hypothetical protein
VTRRQPDGTARGTRANTSLGREAHAAVAAGHNDPGYLPDNPPTITRDWQLARDALIEDLRYAADATQTWADPHDCDDIPCPTYGDDCPDNLAGDLRLAADELQTLEPPARWQTTVGGEA